MVAEYDGDRHAEENTSTSSGRRDEVRRARASPSRPRERQSGSISGHESAGTATETPPTTADLARVRGSARRAAGRRLEVQRDGRRARREVGHYLDPAGPGRRAPAGTQRSRTRASTRASAYSGRCDPGRARRSRRSRSPWLMKLPRVAPVAGRRGVPEVPAGGLQVRRDQRGAAGQQPLQRAVPAVGLGDQQRQAALGEQLGVAAHLGLDVGRVVVGVEVAGRHDPATSPVAPARSPCPAQAISGTVMPWSSAWSRSAVM